MAAENINRKLNIYINDKEVVNSMGGVTRAMSSTRNAIKNLNKGAEDYDEQLKKLKDTYNQLSKEQDSFKKELSGVPSVLGKIKGALGPVASGMIAAFSVGTVITGAMAALGKAKTLIFNFEQGVADLSAITGATGRELDFLSNKAIRLGIETKGGAIAVVEAYQLIASAKPELLDNVEALNQVTEATLLLAKASGMDMPAAATALTDAMNQFGVDASQASVFVDALANGAKYGSAEIPHITEALLKFGAVAKTTNVNIQESTALIEALAEKGLKGAEAGTALRNVMLKLSAPDALPKEAQQMLKSLGVSFDELKDKSRPFSERLEVLKPILKDNAALIKVFGAENVVAATNLLTSTDRIKDLTSKMGEMGTAFEQAAVKMDTVNNKSELLKSKYESLILSIGSGNGVVSNFFKTFIDGASDALGGLLRLNSSWEQLNINARQDGSSAGLASFEKRMNIGKTQGGNEIDVARNIKSPALKDLKNYMNELKKIDDEINGNDEKGFFDRKTTSYINKQKRKKELLIKEIVIQETLISEANKRIDAITNAKPEGTENSGAAAAANEEDNAAAEKTARKREKSLADAKKHAEDLLKTENDLQKELNDSRTKAAELQFGLIKDDYDREKALVNAEYDKKIEDLELNIKKEQQAIDKLKAGIASPKTSQSDLISLKKQLKDRLEIQENYNATMLFTDQTRDLKLGALQEKFLQKELQEQEKQNANALLNLKTRHNNELASVKILEDAKSVLSKSLSVEELAKIKTLDQAKKELKKQQLKEEFDLQKSHLDAIVKKYNDLLNGQTVDGFKIMTNEQRDEIIQNLDLVKNKLSEVLLAGSGSEPAIGTREEGLKSLSSLDILGSSPDQWDAVFNNLGTAESKIQAVTAVVGGLQNAFGMYFQFLEAGDKRNLQKFEAGINRKKAALSDQLEKGFITQEVYTARNAKLDQELAKKKAEIDYKQAKRQKGMQAAQIVSSTALSIMGIWAQVPKFDFGISAGVLTGVVAALGAAQLGLVLAQPLPDKNGFYDGGFTGTGNPRGEAGPVHFNEYVVPQKVLFSNDPVVPQIMGYLEAKRTGKQPLSQEDAASTNASSSNSGSGSNEMDVAVVNALNRNSEVLEKLEEDGLTAFLVNDIKTAKKMRDKIKEVNKLETNAKL